MWADILGFADYCLAGSTKIKIKQTPFVKTIEDIVDDQISPTVFSYDGNEFIRQRVEQWHHRGVKQTYTYLCENGAQVTCTPDHKFLTIDNKFKSIDEIYTNNLEIYTIE